MIIGGVFFIYITLERHLRRGKRYAAERKKAIQRENPFRREISGRILSSVNPYLKSNAKEQHPSNGGEVVAKYLVENSKNVIEVSTIGVPSIIYLTSVIENNSDKCIHAVGARASLVVLHVIAQAHKRCSFGLSKSPLYICFILRSVTEDELGHIPVHLWPHLDLAKSIFSIRSGSILPPSQNSGHSIDIVFQKCNRGMTSTFIDLNVLVIRQAVPELKNLNWSLSKIEPHQQ